MMLKIHYKLQRGSTWIVVNILSVVPIPHRSLILTSQGNAVLLRSKRGYPETTSCSSLNSFVFNNPSFTSGHHTYTFFTLGVSYQSAPPVYNNRKLFTSDPPFCWQQINIRVRSIFFRCISKVERCVGKYDNFAFQKIIDLIVI
jgi:hypothetical protein